MKSDDNLSANISRSVSSAAAKWLERRESGMSESDETRFAEWITDDERHSIAFAEAETTWRMLGQLESLRSSVGQPDPDVLVRQARDFSAKKSTRSVAWGTRFLLPLAAAAALMISYLAWNGRSPVSISEEVVTAVGDQRTLELADGSVVRMNTDSQVEIEFTPSERRIYLLRGEAHFTVAKNRQRQFIVEAGRVAVRAVGTAFNVRRDVDWIEVLVTHGKVQVDDSIRGGSLLAPTNMFAKGLEEIPVLIAGQRTVIPTIEASAPPPVATLAEPELQRSLAWREKRLEFVSAPLSEVVSEFNRYNKRKLVISDQKLSNLRFGGIFRADSSETVVRMLEENFNVVAERHSDRTILRTAESKR